MNSIYKSTIAACIGGALLASAFPAFAAAPELEQKFIIDLPGEDAFTTAEVGSDGSVYMAGAMGNLAKFSVPHSFMTAKFDSNGNLIWSDYHKTGYGSYYGPRMNIAVDSQGNTYAALSQSYAYASLIKYDPDGNKQVLYPGRGIIYNADHFIGVEVDNNDNVYTYGNEFVAKYDTSGTELWNMRFSNKWGASVRDILIDSEGNVYAFGMRDKNAWDAFVTIKYDANGNQLWMRSHYHDRNYQPRRIQFDTDGNILVSGQTLDYSTSPAEWGFSAIKYDLDGNQLGEQFIPSPRDQMVYAYDWDAQGNIITAGMVKTGVWDQTDALITKSTPAGDIIWQQRSDWELWDNYGQIELDADGNIYLRGGSTSCYRCDGGVAITKFDNDGNQLWHFIDANNWRSLWMEVTDEGTLYTGGQAYERIPYEPTTFFAEINRYGSGNQPPVADPGFYAAVECTASLTSVTLDGTASYDPDGDALSYSWSGSFGTLSGDMVTVDLPLGTHDITLTVTDGNGGSHSETTQVIVQDTTAPIVDAGADAFVLAVNSSGAPYNLQYSASDACSAVSVSVAPTSDIYPIGKTVITVTAIDSSGNSASDSMELTVGYQFGGFMSPLREDGIYKLKRTLPIKFQLFYADGSIVTDAMPTLTLYQRNNDEVIGDAIDPQTNAESSDGSTFRFSDDQYIYNLSTDYLSKGQYMLTVDVGDGVNYSIPVSFK